MSTLIITEQVCKLPSVFVVESLTLPPFTHFSFSVGDNSELFPQTHPLSVLQLALGEVEESLEMVVFAHF